MITYNIIDIIDIIIELIFKGQGIEGLNISGSGWEWEEEGIKKIIKDLIKLIEKILREGGSREEIIELQKLLKTLIEEWLGIKIDESNLFKEPNDPNKTGKSQGWWLWVLIYTIVLFYILIGMGFDEENYPENRKDPEVMKRMAEWKKKKQEENVAEIERKEKELDEDRITFWDREL